MIRKWKGRKESGEDTQVHTMVGRTRKPDWLGCEGKA